MRRILELIGSMLSRILGIATLPFRMLGGFFGGGGGGAGPREAQATQQTEEQVRAAQEEAERALALQQVARLLMRVAKRRVDDRDVSDLADALPAYYSKFVSRLTKSECLKLTETDGRTVLAWVQGKRPAPPLP